MVILNGHEWVERQAIKQGLTVGKEGNCFVSKIKMQIVKVAFLRWLKLLFCAIM
jgi:hypothetical protein